MDSGTTLDNRLMFAIPRKTFHQPTYPSSSPYTGEVMMSMADPSLGMPPKIASHWSYRLLRTSWFGILGRYILLDTY